MWSMNIAHPCHYSIFISNINDFMGTICCYSVMFCRTWAWTKCGHSRLHMVVVSHLTDACKLLKKLHLTFLTDYLQLWRMGRVGNVGSFYGMSWVCCSQNSQRCMCPRYQERGSRWSGCRLEINGMNGVLTKHRAPASLGLFLVSV